MLSGWQTKDSAGTWRVILDAETLDDLRKLFVLLQCKKGVQRGPTQVRIGLTAAPLKQGGACCGRGGLL